MTATPTAQMTRDELVAVLRRVNPWGGYCDTPCKHPSHSDDAYRKTVAKLRCEREVAKEEK